MSSSAYPDNREYNAGLAGLRHGGMARLVEPRRGTRIPGYGKTPELVRPLPIRHGVKGARKGGWIQAADKEMEEEGTEGSFTRSARRAKMSVQDYAKKVIAESKKKEKAGKKLSKSELKQYRRAIFARNMGRIAKKRRASKRRK